jgi:hypothetical protein
MKTTANMVLIVAIIAFLCTLTGIWALGEFGQDMRKETQVSIEFILLLLPLVWLLIATSFEIVEDKK